MGYFLVKIQLIYWVLMILFFGAKIQISRYFWRTNVTKIKCKMHLFLGPLQNTCSTLITILVIFYLLEILQESFRFQETVWVMLQIPFFWQVAWTKLITKADGIFFEMVLIFFFLLTVHSHFLHHFLIVQVHVFL